jgi:hypothetical protein
MTEQELRALVRAAIAQHMGGGGSGMHGAHQVPGADPSLLRLHSSHSMFVVPDGSEGDGACVIEPAVACNHCGYCKSLGH